MARELGAAAINVVALALWAVTLVRVGRTPSASFKRGGWSKAANLVVAFSCSHMLGWVFVPWGAFIVLYRLDRDRRTGNDMGSLDLAKPRGPQVPGSDRGSSFWDPQ